MLRLTALQRRRPMLTLVEKVERVVFLLGFIVLMLDLYWWNP